MQKRNILIVLAAIIVIAAGAYVAINRSSKTKSTTGNTTTPTTNSSSNDQQSTKSTNTAIIITKTDSTVGQYLADNNGSALYTYGADAYGVSNCSGSCLASWPAYAPTNSSAALPVNITIIKRSDGTSQYAYKGMALYTFTSDSAGQVTGDKVANFNVAKP